MLPEEGVSNLQQAVLEWSRGRYYEAHEILEDVAECFDDGDPSLEWALAITRIAACLHKLSSRVGVRAVPAKLHTALEALADAPPTWFGIDLVRLLTELRTLEGHIASVSETGVVPSDLRFPVPRPIAAEPERE